MIRTVSPRRSLPAVLAGLLIFPVPLMAQEYDEMALRRELQARFDASFRQASKVSIPPIVRKPGARLKGDVLATHRPWYARVLIAPFNERTAGQPWHDEALRFVSSAVDDLYLRQPKESPQIHAWIEQGKAVRTAGCDDILVDFLYRRLRTREEDDSQRFRNEYESLYNKARGAAIGTALKTFIAREYAASLPRGTPDDALDKQLVAWVKESLTDGSYKPGEGAIFLQHQIAPVWRWLVDRRPDLVSSVYDSAPFEPWALHTLRGWVYSSAGWNARGRSVAAEVTSEGWKGLEKNLAVARRELSTAWKLAPEQPEAAAEMVAVLMSAGSPEGESERLWFDRAIAAQFDHESAYGNLLWSLRPRWGGSLEEMFLFGKACADTGRYETDVPLELYHAITNILLDLNVWEPFFRRPEVREPLMKLSKAFVNEPSRSAEKSMRTSMLAVHAWMCGDVKTAAETLAEIPTLHPDAFQFLNKLDVPEARMRGEVAVLCSAAAKPYEEAEQLFAKGDLKAAQIAYTSAAKSAPKEGAALIESRLSVLAVEQRLATGEWVKLVPRPGLLDWSVQLGDWSADADGGLVNNGRLRAAFVYHQARVGPECEIRADFEVKAGDNYYRAGGIGFGFRAISDKYWTMCHIGGRGDQGEAMILDRYYAAGVPERPVKFPIARNKLFVRVSGGKVTFEVNGERIFDAVEPGKGTTGPKNGRIGFGSYMMDIGNVTRFMDIEVRRLKAQ